MYYIYVGDPNMKFITVRDLRTSPAQVWKDLPVEQEMVITNNGKPIALLTPISDTNLEDTLSTIRRARAINAVKSLQQISIENQNNELSNKEIEAEIKATRKK
jgi:antitoxin (DNA-binding transcriptional repressor) of toxin-antitoxin stability system